MHKQLTTTLAVFSLVTLGVTACNSGSSNGSGSESVNISGAGSTFIYPAMGRWIQEYQQSHANTHINYQSIGSGGGIQQVKSGTVDFGASDTAIPDAQLQAGFPAVVQIPESAGPVCITYNLPNMKEPLKLTGAALAGIFLGNIKTWQDAEIAKANPGVSLPKLNIAVVHRADGSGTTGIFTNYLGAVSPEWKSKVGVGNSVSWPLGIGGKGSEGVTGQLRNLPGAIGYVELAYAQQNNLPVAAVGNQAGKYIAPSPESTTAAINAFKDQLNHDPRLPIVNAPASAADAYPIAGMTFLIIPKDGPDKAKRTALRNFVQYVITDGQATAKSLNYAPLPDGVQAYDKQQLSQLMAGGQPIP